MNTSCLLKILCSGEFWSSKETLPKEKLSSLSTSPDIDIHWWTAATETTYCPSSAPILNCCLLFVFFIPLFCLSCSPLLPDLQAYCPLFSLSILTMNAFHPLLRSHWRHRSAVQANPISAFVSANCVLILTLRKRNRKLGDYESFSLSLRKPLAFFLSYLSKDGQILQIMSSKSGCQSFWECLSNFSACDVSSNSALTGSNQLSVGVASHEYLPYRIYQAPMEMTP